MLELTTHSADPGEHVFVPQTDTINLTPHSGFFVVNQLHLYGQVREGRQQVCCCAGWIAENFAKRKILDPGCHFTIGFCFSLGTPA